MLTQFRIAALCLVMLLSAPSGAHQQKEAITRVLFNDRTGNIEVMHRFLLHDAEHAGRKLFGESIDLLGESSDRMRFQAYVLERFSLSNQDGEPLDLTPVGNEIENQFLWVYAETPIPGELTAITLSHDALRDLWPEQVNLVNVERNQTVQTALFNGDARAITIRF